MKKQLIDVIFASEKRKDVLLLLKEKPREMSVILDHLHTTRTSLLPQMRILEDHFLVTASDDTYELTTIGKVIVNKMVPLLNKTELFDDDIDYWGTHELGFIPPHLFERINELGECEIVSPSIHEIYSIHRSFNSEYGAPRSVYTVTNLLYPDFKSIIEGIFEEEIDFHFIISQELLKIINKEHSEEFTEFLKNKFFNMYVYNKEMKFLQFTFDNVHFVLCALNNNGEFDQKYMFCKGQNAVGWIEDLFEYCLKDSTLLTEI
ncbi:MAG: putative transcriptional regulator [Methanolobus sp. T82-4]|nr:MAG: putative transcriptional regulator [Methanolobus sp. T82-4]